MSSRRHLIPAVRYGYHPTLRKAEGRVQPQTLLAMHLQHMREVTSSMPEFHPSRSRGSRDAQGSGGSDNVSFASFAPPAVQRLSKDESTSLHNSRDSLLDMDLLQILESPEARARLLLFARSLLCDHLIAFLICLHPFRIKADQLAPRIPSTEDLALIYGKSWKVLRP